MSSSPNIYLHTEQGNVAQDGVEVHEDILDHDVDIGPSPLDDVLIVHPSKDRAQHLLHKGDYSDIISKEAHSPG